MKKQLLGFGVLCMALTFGGNAVAQAPALTAVFGTTTTAPTIDGVADALWSAYSAHPVNINWPANGISMQEETVATWQACWDATATYVLVTVPDDHCFTHVEAGVASWLADKPEIYFDVNAEKVEDPAVGPSTAGSGHYQYAPDFTCMETPPTNHTVAFTIDANDAGYIYEYAVPHASMADLDATPFAPADGLVIGFDVTIIDLDADGSGANLTTGHANWSNDMLTAGESWVDMTFSGDVTYSDATGVDTKVANTNVLMYTVVTEKLEFNVAVAEVKVMNSLGQVVKTNSDVSNLTNGVYIVSVKTASGEMVANRFVKQ